MKDWHKKNKIELLKLAAFSAGEWPSPEPFEHVLSRWNPWDDDGDAFRLAIMLGIQVEPNILVGKCVARTQDIMVALYENQSEVPYSASRRAVVYVAAEIGLQMQEKASLKMQETVI